MFPRISLTTFSEPFLITPNAPITTGIISVFICHILVISISRSLYFERFSETLVEVLLSEGIAVTSAKRALLYLLLLRLGLRKVSTRIFNKQNI